MMVMISETCIGVLQWLADASWVGLAIIVSCQLVLIAVAGFLMTHRVSGKHAEVTHRIWLSAIALAVALIPIHVLIGGWPLRLAIPQAETEMFGLEMRTAVDNNAPGGSFADTVLEGEFARAGGQSETPVTAASTAAVSSRAANTSAVHQQVTSPEVSANSPGQVKEVTAQTTVTASAIDSLCRDVAPGLVVAYLTGLLVVVTRLVFAAMRLRRWSRDGRELGEQVHQEVVASTAEIGLSRPPAVRVVTQAAMPLVFGCLRPVVLVPAAFESWPRRERHATLMHEFMHIHRRDLIGQWLSQCMCSIYWFNPAAWFMTRRLREAREWATDRQVVDGMIDARQYAETLLSIVSRMEASRAAAAAVRSAAIAMSSPGAIEDRLRRLLQSSPQRSFPIRVLGRAAIGLLLVLVTVTSIRVERVAAQSDATAAPAKESVDQRAKENDLFARIRDCDVLTVTGDQFDAIFNVDGVVLSDAGEPVSGAIVLLRESSTARLSSEREKYLRHQQYPLLRTADVFARTVTDATGRFEFRDAKSPALPKAWSNSWRGNVVAAHRDLGLGWLSLSDKNEKRRLDSGMTIVLKPTTSIEGKYVSDDDVGIDGATAHLDRLVEPNGRPLEADDLDLQMSQLTPHANTDQDGLFRFDRVPRGFIALAGVSDVSDDGDRVGGSVVIATSEEVPLGIEGNQFSHVYGDEVVRSPALVTEDSGVLVTGQVRDENGRPVSEVEVSLASTSVRDTTASEGKFKFRIPLRWIHREQGRGIAVMRLYAAPKTESSLLSEYCEVSIGDLLAGKPVTIDLQAGAIVRGRVVTEDDQPLADASVRPLTPSKMFGAKTQSDGTYQFVAPAGPQIVVATINDAGYSVPSRSQFYSATEDDVSGWPQQSMELTVRTPVEIPPIVVPRVRPLRVIVSLPDGEPATGATAIIKDEIAQKNPPGSRFVRPPRVIDQSEPVMTNAIGRAELLPKGSLTDQAKVHVKMSTADNAYDGRASVSAAVDGVLNVVLQPARLLQGRVLLDGKPVAGAKVSIGESTRMSSTRGGISVGFTTVSNHIHAITDRDGWYRAAVSRDKEYSVSVQSMPGDSERPGVGFRPQPDGDGKLRVEDFAFYRGDREIAGRVVDRQGAPIQGANVEILRSSNVSPDFWMGHKSESQFITDKLGRFHLKRVPAGTYPLRINGPKDESTRERVATMMTVDAGTTGVEIALDTEPSGAIPRLQPKRIVPIETSESAP